MEVNPDASLKIVRDVNSHENKTNKRRNKNNRRMIIPGTWD